MVNVNVGPGGNTEKFTTHRELLCFYSPFFKSMMNGNWEEAKSDIINLPADEPEVYEVFQNWLYGVDLNLELAQSKDVSLLLKLWIFGDKIQVPSFQNAAMDGLRLATIEPPRIIRRSEVATAFAHSGEGSPLRKFIVDIYVWEGSLYGLMDRFLDEAYPKAFITQFFEAYVDAFPRPAHPTVKKNRPYGYSAHHYHIQYPYSSIGQAGTDESKKG